MILNSQCNTDFACQHPEILKKLISDHDMFAMDVGGVTPTGSIEAFKTVGEASGYLAIRISNS